MPNHAPEETDQHLKINMLSSFTAGTFIAAVFHPWDRALFLAIDSNRAFCLRANFATPFHGVAQAIIYKPFTNSIYFFVQSELKENFYPYLRHDLNLSESSAQFGVGLVAGGIEGIVKNPLSAIKSNTWKHGKEGSFLRSVREMWMHGKIKPFINGAPAGVSRDMVFGATYELIRNKSRTQFKEATQTRENNLSAFLSDSGAAAIATIMCSPFNYARTMQYRTAPGEKPPTILESIDPVCKQTRAQPKLLSKLSFFQRSLCIGWGTARVAVGMATGQLVADQVKDALKKIDNISTPAKLGKSS
jgi:hypothetical protein